MATKKTNTKSNTKSKKNTNSKKKNQEQKRNNSTMIFLVIILILLGIIAYAYRDKLEVLYNSTITYINDKDKKEDKKQTKDNQLKQSIDKLEKKQSKKTTTTTTTIRKKQKFEKVTTTTTTTTVRRVATTTTITVKKEITTTTTTTTIKKEVINQPQKSKQTKIYFTKVTDDKLFPCTVSRNVVYGDAPLTETINALLQGPTSNEENNDIVTNIPEGTKLLSAYVKGSTAFLNFSSQFENNHFGKEATVFQLYQIVYTATEFDNIKSVQIMINGKIVEYLGGEGVLIGTPLKRTDF